MISIIVPALNEKNYLPKLLTSITSQDFTDYEIIVADAGSTDGTLDVARHHGCIITEGGRPARGRNNGAKVAKGDLLLFLDADTVLPAHFLKVAVEKFQQRHLDIATFGLRMDHTNILSYILVDVIYNTWIWLTQSIWPYSAVGILIKKPLFEKLNGYAEDIPLTEDYDLGRRAVKHGKFGVIASLKITSSDRRFRNDGWFSTSAKYLLCELHNIFLGPARRDIFNYKFNHYKKDGNDGKQ